MAGGPAGPPGRRGRVTENGMAEESTVRVADARIRAQLEAVFQAWGMTDALIGPTVRVMADTDLRGVDSHGIAMVPLYDRIRRSGALNLTPDIRTERETAVTAVIDGDAGLGHAISVKAMDLCIAKAKASGLAAVAVRNSHHFGAAGAYAMQAAEAGLIGYAMTSALSAIMVPTRAKAPFFATNPLAFAVPAGRNRPFMLDMATTTVAVGKIKLAWYAGKLLPEGWLVDPQGNGLREAAEGFDGTGRLKTGYGVTPLGATADTASHKGYGLGAMVEVLSSLLAGASFAGRPSGKPKAGEPEDVGHFFLCIDPKAFRETEDFLADMDAMLDAMHALPPADPALPVLVPGEPEDIAAADRLLNGVPLPEKLLAQMRDICRASNAAYLLEG